MDPRSMIAGLILVAVVVPIADRAALAANAGDLCAAAKLVAASRYAECSLRAEARFARTGDTSRRQAALLDCATRLAAGYRRAEARFGSACPTLGDAADAEGFLAQCTAVAAAATSGDGFPATPTPAPTATLEPTPLPTHTPPPTPGPTAMPQLIGYSGPEFSATQGRNSWFYGTYPDAPADLAFVPMPEFQTRDDPSPGRWWASRETSWASIWADGQKPAGETSSCGKTATGDWAVRRWVSRVADRIRITGLTGKQEIGSDGAIARVIVDGDVVFTRLVDGDAGLVAYEVYANVMVGSTVDFAVSANGSDCSDAVKFTAIIEQGDF